MEEKPTQPPSQGRVVHYVHSGQIYTALVCFVHSDSVVNLAVYDHQGGHLGGRTSCTFNSDRTTHNTWSYPPFVKPARRLD